MHSSYLRWATLVALCAGPALAQAELAFNAGAVSDYRYRGISQSRLKPALQGGVDYSAGNWYAGVWGSTVRWIKDGAGGADAEFDLYGGYKGEISKGLGFDLGLLSYQYPGHKLGLSPNTTEVYGALSFGPATLKYSHSLSNLFGFGGSKNSGYLDLGATFELGDGVSLAPHLGYQKVHGNSAYSYTDYSLMVSKAFGAVTLSAAAVGASVKDLAGVPAYASPAGKDLGKAGLVLGAKYAF